MDTVWQDVRLALRLVRRSPGFAAIIVFTLALGIGANAAIFGVVNGLLLRPLPVADPHRLVTISSDAAIARGYPAGFGWTFAMWKELQPHVDLFDGTLAWTPARFDLAPSGERQLVEGLFASGGYFATLGVPAVLGRTFTAADDRPGGGAEGPVAVISYGLWQRRFGGAAGVVGGPLVVDGVTVTIVGVTPPGFFGADVGRAFDVALPLETEPLIRGNRPSLRMSPLLVMLRLKPGQSTEAGTATLRNLQPAILGVTPENMSTVRPPHNREPFTLVSAAAGTSLPVRGPSGLRQSYARPLVTILVVVLLVLVIACVLADVAGFGERGRVGDHERHVQQARERLREQRLARAGRADEQDVRLRELDLVVLRQVLEPLVVVVDRDRKDLLRLLLADHVLVEDLADLLRRREVGFAPGVPPLSVALSSRMMSLQSSMHSSQMNTDGPAISLRTSCWLLPQNEQ